MFLIVMKIKEVTMNVLEKTIQKETTKSAIKDSLKHNHLEGHAALERLKDKLNVDYSHTGELITSYDRMHHRHNRS